MPDTISRRSFLKGLAMLPVIPAALKAEGLMGAVPIEQASAEWFDPRALANGTAYWHTDWTVDWDRKLLRDWLATVEPQATTFYYTHNDEMTDA